MTQQQTQKAGSKRIIAFLCVAALALVFLWSGTAALAAGSEIHVSASGNDETGDGSSGNPYATLQKALAASHSGDTLVLDSDIALTSYVNIWHDLTIDGQGHTVTRQAGFAATSDTSRSWYNPAMFEVHPDNQGTTVTFKDITLDDDLKREATGFSDQATVPANTSANLSRVQDGIISLYNDPANTYKCQVILESGTTLQNFGGMNGVNLEGNSELIMKNGSKITNNGASTRGEASGVLCLAGGKLTMEDGSLITDINGSNAIFTNDGTAVINGEISNISGGSGTPLRSTGISTVTLGQTGDVHDLNVGNAALYCFGGATTYNIDGKIHDITCGVKRGGIWPSNSSGHVINITEHAEIYNIPGQAVRMDQGNIVNVSGGYFHDNGIALFIRRATKANITGGKFENNTYAILLADDGTSNARISIDSDALEFAGNEYNYFVDRTPPRGYDSDQGSFMYLSDKTLSTSPVIHMSDTNADNYTTPVSRDKELAVAPSNGTLYLGNASNPSKAAASGDPNASGATILASWFGKPATGTLTATATLPNPNGTKTYNDHPRVYALLVPISEDGSDNTGLSHLFYDTGVDIPATGDVTVPLDLPGNGSEHGYTYVLFAFPDEVTTPPTVQVSKTLTITKTWDDADDMNGARPDSIDITLSHSDSTVTTLDGGALSPVTLKASEGWKKTLGFADTVDMSEFTVTENPIVNYQLKNTPTVSGSGSAYTAALENEYVTTVRVVKIWDDAENKDGIRPLRLDVTLQKAGATLVDVDGKEAKITLYKDGNFSAEVKLPADDYSSITAVEESLPAEYTATSTNVIKDLTGKYTVVLVNEHKITPKSNSVANTYEVPTDFTGKKVWTSSYFEKSALPHPQITMFLYADGAVVRRADINPATGKTVEYAGNTKLGEGTVTVNADGGFEYKFENLPKYTSADATTPIVYTVKEEITDAKWVKVQNAPPTWYSLDGKGKYTASVNTVGDTITNDYDTLQKETSVEVEKIWKDHNNEANKRPTAVTLGLFDASGNQVVDINGNPAQVTLNEAGNWKGTFEHLYLYKKDGTKFDYSSYVIKESYDNGATWIEYGDTEKGYTYSLVTAP